MQFGRSNDSDPDPNIRVFFDWQPAYIIFFGYLEMIVSKIKYTASVSPGASLERFIISRHETDRKAK